MDDKILLKTFLADQTLAAVQRGLWYFAEGPLTDQWIPPWDVYRLAAGWSALAADLLVAEPTGGLFSVAYRPGLRWVERIAAVLEQRGIELPATQVGPGANDVWGAPFAHYPAGATVTVFVDVHTLGGQARRYRRRAEAGGLRVGRVIALIDRGPTQTRQVDGIPFASVLHLPLSLYAKAVEVPLDTYADFSGSTAAAHTSGARFGMLAS